MTDSHARPARGRILFVDDDPLVLAGLRRALRHLRTDFDLEFAESGLRALDILASAEYDVVVSDMRMPGMDGAALLAEVQRRHPRTVRIVLSGQSDQAQIMRCLGCAHRFLPKPCEPAELDRVLAQISLIRSSLVHERFREIVARMDRIPAVPILYLRIVEALQKPEVGVDEVAELIEQEPSTTAGLLRVVNSAYFGLAERIFAPRDAVRYLGLDMVRALILADGTYRQMEAWPGAAEAIELVWHHSMEVAVLAGDIARGEGASPRTTDECFVAGLLHDIGKIVLAVNFRESWTFVEREMAVHRRPCHEAEHDVFGVTHADLAGGIFGLWGLPGGIVDAVQFHHRPGQLKSANLTPALVVHCADLLVHEFSTGNGGAEGHAADRTALEKAGLGHRWEAWRQLAASRRQNRQGPG
ncbi:MAG: HDOD domain-containing protein [Opitutaceae bacterium]|nr:HDOD domain-containing protein [Opitutaceae bacterium]